jgi:integrase
VADLLGQQAGALGQLPRSVGRDPLHRIIVGPEHVLAAKDRGRVRRHLEPVGDGRGGTIWKPALKAAGLDGLRIHDLRHTAVARWIAAGANPKEVAARAGHASVSFTLDRYGQLYPEADLSLRDRLDAIWSASGGGQ